MRLIIAGSRDFDDYALLVRETDALLKNFYHGEIEIVSGGARGADNLGEKYARLKRYALKVFQADWRKFGKSAGYIRNEEMAKYADHLLLFWDGESRGSKHMLDLAQDYGLVVKVVKFGVVAKLVDTPVLEAGGDTP